MEPKLFELEKEIYNVKDKIHELKKEMARILSEIIEAEDQLLALEEEQMYLAAGEELPERKDPCACGGHCRGKARP